MWLAQLSPCPKGPFTPDSVMYFGLRRYSKGNFYRSRFLDKFSRNAVYEKAVTTENGRALSVMGAAVYYTGRCIVALAPSLLRIHVLWPRRTFRQRLLSVSSPSLTRDPRTQIQTVFMNLSSPCLVKNNYDMTLDALCVGQVEALSPQATQPTAQASIRTMPAGVGRRVCNFMRLPKAPSTIMVHTWSPKS